MRRLPAISRIWRFTTASDSTGRFPCSASRSYTTTYGIRQALQMRANSGMFPFPPHSSTSTPSLSASMPSASNTSGNVSFSVRPSTSSAARARNSSARSLSNSDSARKPSASASGSRLEERRPRVERVTHERELLDPVDAQEDRCVRRVEDLVALLRERAQQTVEVALRVRAQVELGLLDEHDEAAHVRLEQPLHPQHELQAAVRGRPVMLGDGRPEQLRDRSRARAGRRRDERSRAQVRRQEQHRRSAGPVQVQRVRRPGVEEDRALARARPRGGCARPCRARRRRRSSAAARPLRAASRSR